jgi:hypothetical protein
MIAAAAQNKSEDEDMVKGHLSIRGKYYPFTINECGDTLILAELTTLSVSSLRTFGTDEDMARYRRYRQFALDVYPYAVEAIRIFRSVENSVGAMKKKERKRYVKELQQELNKEFKEPLKGLSRTQGMILFKMIERELDTPIYDLIKDLRNGLAATYWSTVGSMYGHNLKAGYIRGQDPILDAVLNDLDVSYEPQVKK